MGTPRSIEFCEVHFPVPFEPALSRIISTIDLPVSASFCVKISAVISNRNDRMSPSLPFLKTSYNSVLVKPTASFKNVIDFADQLHNGIFNSIVHHLYVMTRRPFTHIGH